MPRWPTTSNATRPGRHGIPLLLFIVHRASAPICMGWTRRRIDTSHHSRPRTMPTGLPRQRGRR